MTININSYDNFLDTAKSQQDPQRLLFVFVEAESSPDPDAKVKQSAAGQQGGTLTPVMCVDKLPTELGSFASLVEESRQTGQHWDIVFAAALSGRAGAAPDDKAAEQSLKKMIDAIQQGAIGNFLAFNRTGELVQFS